MSIQKPSVVTFLPTGERGVAKVDHFEVSKEDSERTAMRAAFGHGHEYVPPGKYARLTVKGELMMTDTLFEWRSNSGAVWVANGDVLIGGLGIGMVLVPILQNPAVRSVTVVEKYQDVIDLVEAPLRQTVPEASKLTIVCADILEWKPPKGQTWDVAYFDIWPTMSPDNVPEMSKLKRRFARRLRRKNPRAWMGCWEEHRVRDWLRQERREQREWGY
jgi:hypothetical protein